MNRVEQPKHRSRLRAKSGLAYYAFLRKLLWIKHRRIFAKQVKLTDLPYQYFEHQTLLRRKLKDVDMYLQENKIVNLKIAIQHLNGLIIKPNEIFSYWYLIGKPTSKKGYVDGMVLNNGGFHAATGGGLCQLSNLIFWLAIHTPLTIVERHRHGYDVFPDSNRTQPFGSGATCFYPHVDLMIKNETSDTFQLKLEVGDTHLHGSLRSSSEPQYKFDIVEKNHEMRQEYWGGYTRHNEIYQEVYDLEGNLLDEQLIVKNSAIMMYPPFIES